MSSRRLFMVVWVFVVIISLTLIGCSSITKENYDKLKVGMGFDQVVEVLGKADECGSALGAKNCTWGNETKYIKVKFVADKAVFFSKKGI